MRRRARLVEGRFLYRWLNFSLRVLLPSAYGERRKLTKDVYRQHLAPFSDAEWRGRVLGPWRALLERWSVALIACVSEPAGSVAGTDRCHGFCDGSLKRFLGASGRAP
jgi:hypothetical protein